MYCPIPWTSVAVRSNGDFRLCCQANSADNGGLLRDSQNNTLNAAKDPIDKARNSELARNVRLSMLNGQWHSTCQRCQREENAGLRSRRIYSNDMFGDLINFDSAKSITAEDGSIPANTPVFDLDLRFGNLCNLKCRMCGPTDSSSWYNDYVQLFGKTFKDSHGVVELEQRPQGGWRPKGQDYDWYSHKNFWQELDRVAAGIRHIYVVGGEPLLIEEHFQFLERLVQLNLAQQILLEYNTNLTVLPERALKLWPSFRQVNIGVSLDGVGPVNDYIRSGSAFHRIVKNIQTLDVLPGNYRLWLAGTVSVYNIFHLPEMMRWKIEQQFQRVNQDHNKPFWTLHPLHNPPHLNIKILPQSAKEEVVQSFEKFHAWLANWTSENLSSEKQQTQWKNAARKTLDGYVSYMMKEDWSHLIPRFMQYTQDLDKLRHQNINLVNPQLMNHFSGAQFTEVSI